MLQYWYVDNKVEILKMWYREQDLENVILEFDDKYDYIFFC